MTHSVHASGSVGAPLRIRALRAADRSAWTALWRDYLAFYGTSVPAETYARTFALYTDPAEPRMFAFVAVQEETPVALVHAICHPHGWKTADVVYLQDLFTAPGARGQGAGRALIEAVYAEADARGLAGVYWLTQRDNTAARALYDKIAEVTPFIKYQRVPP